ncbi:LPXTG-motif cell wall anchor domain-containing protein/fimbrial isopeptide formation D2 domain-containing protein, partial [Halobacillus alkaliphilus]
DAKTSEESEESDSNVEEETDEETKDSSNETEKNDAKTSEESEESDSNVEKDSDDSSSTEKGSGEEKESINNTLIAPFLMQPLEAVADEGVNLEASWESVFGEVQSGRDALYELELKVTGSREEYSNGLLVLDLPDNESVPVMYSQLEDEQIGDTYSTDENGLIQVGDLLFGDYYFVEVEAPEGYALSNEPLPFTVDLPGTISESGEVTGEMVEVEKDNYEMPEIDKKIVDPDTGDLVNELDINRTAEYGYQIDSQLPGNIQDYVEYYVTDNLDARLSLVEDSIEVTADGEPFNGVNISVEGQLITAEVTDFAALEGVSMLTMTYTAAINPAAELNPEETGIPNDAALSFNNDQGEDGDIETPPTTVRPIDGGVTVVKLDADDGSTLEGAIFDLLDAEGNQVQLPESSVIRVNGEEVSSLEGLTTDEAGQIIITGLNVGDYQLKEVQAPTYTDENGEEKAYRLPAKPFTVTITEESAEENQVNVENSKSGWEIPDTGGKGTLGFTLLGSVIMVTALLIFWFRRKKNTGE